jgi:hypothetical protein
MLYSNKLEINRTIVNLFDSLSHILFTKIYRTSNNFTWIGDFSWTRIGLIFSGHGFGFNTNILETNVINLAVVIAVVVSVVGGARID